ncbi:hypothetical protein H0H92_004245 [Tricholoma furcatifolium]|nr:hypothetical protein H0H92_004245 [Tricholoma furcatifolium]
MISAFFIFNQKGETFLHRRSIADVFRIQVVSNSDVRSPIITLGSTSFFHVRINNLYVVAVTKNNANAALVFEFCYRFINIAKAYFGKIDEESVKNNFVLIYELIDEINDFGYPQNSEIDTLKSYITTESVVSSAIAAEESSKITTQATGATSWRRGDVKYKKNEAFVDVVETVNLSMSAKGTVLRADVDGHIQMRAYLSGTPECKFGLNDKLVIDKSERGIGDAVELDDCRFHQCVRLNDFDATRTISFIPPDGEFELMRYRSTSNVKLPLRVLATVNEIGTSQVSYTISVKTNFNNKLSATNVVLRIPTPLNTTTVDCKVMNGKAKYVPAENVIVWKIPRLQGGSECTFTGTGTLASTTTRQVWARPPIDVDFQVLMFTASGLIVRFLKVFEKNNYQSVKWVRYLTKASGTYQIRHKMTDEIRAESYVGFDSITQQIEHKLLKRGFQFNVIVAGQTGLGKSTLINTIFASHLIDSKGRFTADEPVRQTTEIQAVSHVIVENGVKLRLNIVDTPGYGDQVNNENCWDPIIKYIKDQHSAYLRKELTAMRDRYIQDTRIHCCLYFINPTGHSLRPIDVIVMKKLSEVVNVVPVIAKSDSLTPDERDRFKAKIREELQYESIRLYPFDQDEDDEEEVQLNAAIRNIVPFAVVGSENNVIIDGKSVRGRRNRWGVVNVENPEHCEFVNLRNFLLRTHLQDLIETTAQIHYEAFRSKQLLALKEGVNQRPPQQQQ